jgi:hypothetical protein
MRDKPNRTPCEDPPERRGAPPVDRLLRLGPWCCRPQGRQRRGAALLHAEEVDVLAPTPLLLLSKGEIVEVFNR